MADETISMTVGGRTTEPISMDEFERRTTRQLAMFEGASYPDVEIKVAGGVNGSTLGLLPEITGKRVGETFTLIVEGEIVSKQHKLKRDQEGEEHRVLVVTLKVDSMREPTFDDG